jgi:hypothetical protein
MSSPAGFGQWQSHEVHAPPPASGDGDNEEGISVRPMRRMYYEISSGFAAVY